MTQDATPLGPEYDHLPIGALQHHVRGLDTERLRLLRGYETAHADRPAVLAMIDSRLGQLADGAEPSKGSTPQAPAPASGGSPVSPDTAAEPATPHRHGQVGQSARRARP